MWPHKYIGDLTGSMFVGVVTIIMVFNSISHSPLPFPLPSPLSPHIYVRNQAWELPCRSSGLLHVGSVNDCISIFMFYVLCFMFYVLCFMFYVLCFIFYLLSFIFYLLSFIFCLSFFIFHHSSFIVHLLSFIPTLKSKDTSHAATPFKRVHSSQCGNCQYSDCSWYG